ncbi:hypothetical protein AGLY_015951 [Aphis glycines]|uniref:Uncharacterized protein n=1 Tax=Aphis glycines TaxID=307491 RepID=A0A6G0SYJ3_APHGL|nr:hypothetical protein AGLY_015951 [Aphis glycines]
MIRKYLPCCLFLYIHLLPSSTDTNLSRENPALTKAFTKVDARLCRAESTGTSKLYDGRKTKPSNQKHSRSEYINKKTYGSWQATNIFVIVSVSLTDIAKHNALGLTTQYDHYDTNIHRTAKQTITKNVPISNTEYPLPFVRCYQQKKANKICKRNNSSTSFLNYGIGRRLKVQILMNVVKIRNNCELFCIIQNNLNIEDSMATQNSLQYLFIHTLVNLTQGSSKNAAICSLDVSRDKDVACPR